MYSPLSSDWDLAIRHSGARPSYLDVYANVADTVPAITDLPMKSWSVNIDRRSDMRRTATVVLANHELLQEMKTEGSGSTLTPYGSVFRLKTGVRHPDGSEELVPLGVFRSEQISWNQDETEMTFDLVDLSIILQGYAFFFPFPASGFSALQLERDWVGATLGVTVTCSPELMDYNLPGGTTYDGTYLEAVLGVAQSLGADFYLDAGGRPYLTPVPYIPPGMTEAEADWVIDSGDAGVLVSYASTISRRDTYNQLVVSGSATEGLPQPVGYAGDEDYYSPTFIFGNFGLTVKKIERKELLTVEQCHTVAAAELRNSIGLSSSISLQNVSNPALDVGDIVAVKFPNGPSELHLVDQITIDHTGASSIDTRARRVVL